ncbi:MAG: HAD family hydrolase [Bacteroidota bacterium]
MVQVAVIYDLDDTIFPTSSIPAVTFKPVFDAIRLANNGHILDHRLQQAFDELWMKPMDVVCHQYGFTSAMTEAGRYALINTDYHLKISPFDDFEVIKNISGLRILVTTGITKLQQAKIDALFNSGDFDVVVIDDPYQVNRLGKKKIFSALASRFQLSPEQVWVIGDNPDSEIAAGNELRMNTVQIVRPGIKPSDKAGYVISSFYELEKLIERN